MITDSDIDRLLKVEKIIPGGISIQTELFLFIKELNFYLKGKDDLFGG